MTYSLPETVRLGPDFELPGVLVAAAVCVSAFSKKRAWHFIFRGTTSTKFGEAVAWYDWQVVPDKDNEASATGKLQREAARRMMTRIEIAVVSDPKTRAMLAAGREQKE